MPTYDYYCQKCDTMCEVRHSMNDNSMQPCPLCHSPMSKQVGTGGGIIFRGPGFYHTDYKSPRKPMSEVTDRGEKIERRKNEIKRIKKNAPKTMF